MVGTPIIACIGSSASAALQCPHPAWIEECREEKDGFLMVMERCTACRLATRGRYRPAKEGDMK